MARFGRDFVRAATQPAFTQGLFTAAAGLGGMPRRRREEAEAEDKKNRLMGMLQGATPGTAEYSSILADYYSEIEKDPQKANTLGAMARELAQAEATQIKSERTLSNLKAAGRAKASKSPNAEQLLPLINSMTASQLQDYLKPAVPSEFTLSEGQVRFRGDQEIARVDKPAEPAEIKYVTDDIVNPETGLTESVRIGYRGNKEVSRSVLGLVPSKDGTGKGGAGGKDGKQTLAQFFKDAGIEVDLNTIEGLRQAEKAAYFNLSNASLANTINSLIQEKKEPGVTEGLELLRTNPAVAKAEEDLILVGKYRALESLSETDTAGISRLLQRTLTSTVPNDIKALQEMQLFTKSQGLKDRVDDFFNMAINGRLTEETLREYSDVMQAIQDFSEYQITSAARNLAVFGNEKEQKMAEKVIGYYGGSTARVVD